MIAMLLIKVMRVPTFFLPCSSLVSHQGPIVPHHIDARTFCCLSLSLSLCLCLCLCLCQTNLHMRVARHLYTPAAEEAQQQVAPQLWTFVFASKCLLEQTAALVQTGSSIVQQHAGCTAHLPPPLPSLAVTWCLHRRVFRKSRRPTLAQRLHIASFSPSLSVDCSHTWFRRTFGATFCMRASHADVCPELLQDTWEPGDHVQDGAPHLGRRFVFVFHPIVNEAQGHGAPCPRTSPACSISLRKVHWTARCGLALAPPYLQRNSSLQQPRRRSAQQLCGLLPPCEAHIVHQRQAPCPTACSPP